MRPSHPPRPFGPDQPGTSDRPGATALASPVARLAGGAGVAGGVAAPRRLPWALVLVALLVIALRPAVAWAAPSAAGAGDAFDAYRARGWLWMYLGSFGAGFLTSLTPCVYPLIPITLGIFGARGKDVSRGRAIALAAAYVVGMGLTYAVLGVVVASVGGQFGTQLSNPYVVIPLVLLFVALAMSMFGAFELNLPPSLQARLNQVGGQGFGGAFAMGLVGGFIAAPCTGPFLAGLLAFVASTGSVVGGGSLLFVYALGMGVLFFAIAAFAMSLPRSGRWMEWVKSGGGLLLLVGAIYFLRPLLPWMRTFAPPDRWFLYAALGAGAAGLALGAIHLSFHGGAVEKARKGAGVALVLAAVFCAWSWLLTPKHHLPWVHGDEAAAFARAKAEGKGVMVDFSATWCTPCEELELTFGDDEVYRELTAHFVPLKFDVSQGTDEDGERRARYGARTLPTVVFLGPDRDVLARIMGKKVEPDELLALLRPALAKLAAPAPAR